MWLAWNRNRYTCASKRIDTFLKLCAWKWRVGGYQWLGCVQLVQLTPLPEWLMLQVSCLIVIVLDANEIKLWIVPNYENQFISWQEQLRQRVGERESNSIFMLMARGKILFWREGSRKRTSGFDLGLPLVRYVSNNPYFTMNLVRVRPYLRPYHHPSPPSPRQGAFDQTVTAPFAADWTGRSVCSGAIFRFRSAFQASSLFRSICAAITILGLTSPYSAH